MGANSPSSQFALENCASGAMDQRENVPGELGKSEYTSMNGAAGELFAAFVVQIGNVEWVFGVPISRR